MDTRGKYGINRGGCWQYTGAESAVMDRWRTGNDSNGTHLDRATRATLYIK